MHSLADISAAHTEPMGLGCITVAIAEDHTVVRHALRMLIDAVPEMHVVAEAGSVADTMRMTREHRPAVLVLDLNLRGESVLSMIPGLREDVPETAIVVLTMQDDPGFAREALQCGALGYVLKEAADEELLEAIRLAADGGTYLNPRLGARLAAQQREVGPHDDLSEREIEVLRLISLGHTNTEIAGLLYLSTRTVETHRAHIQRKIRWTSRAELVRYALDHGLVRVEPVRYRAASEDREAPPLRVSRAPAEWKRPMTDGSGRH